MLDSEWSARKMAFEAWLDPANFDDEGRQRKSLGQLHSSVAWFFNQSDSGSQM